MAKNKTKTACPKTKLYLSESEQCYQNVVNNIAVGVALISPKMEILSLNRQMRKWFPEIKPNQKPICFKSFNRPPRAKLCSYCPTIKTLRDGRIHEAITATPRNDKIINFRIIASPIKDSNGRIVAVIEMVEDITQKQKSQEQLQLFRNLINRATDLIVVVRPKDGRLLDFNDNACRLLGYSRYQLGQLTVVDICPDYVNYSSWRKGVKRLRARGNNFARMRGKTRSGKEFPVSVNTHYMKYKDNDYIVAIVRDISEQIVIEERLEKQQKQLIASQENLKRFSQRLLNVREEEKKLLSIELHDQLGAMAIGVSSSCALVEQEIKHGDNHAALLALKTSREIFKASLDQLRQIVVGLMPPNLDIVGLPIALKEIARKFCASQNIKLLFESNIANHRISNVIMISIYRIAQESLTNIVRHAQGATKVWLKIIKKGKNIELVLRDNGCGFDYKKYTEGKKRDNIGIQGMQERVALLSGEFLFDSKIGQGTKLKAVIPLKNTQG